MFIITGHTWDKRLSMFDDTKSDTELWHGNILMLSYYKLCTCSYVNKVDISGCIQTNI